MGNNKYIYYFVPKEVVMGKESKTIRNVREFELVGRGIDGIVLRFDEKRVIKILKDSTELQKKNNKMTYEKLNYVIARFLYLEMKKCKDLTKEECKTLNDWVKKMPNSYTFKRELEQEIGINYREKISDYAEEKAKYIIKHR